MNTDVLRYCLDIAEYLSFTKVAEKNHLTQQALSQQIINLENSIGVRLFDRSSRSVSVTPAGNVFLKDVAASIACLDSAIVKAQMFSSGCEGVISLGCNGPYSHGRFINIIQEFTRLYPNIGINFSHSSYGSIVNEFKGGAFDLIATGAFEDYDEQKYGVIRCNSGIIKAVLGKRHPLANRTSVTLDELFEETYICLALLGDGEAHMRRLERLRKHFGGRLPPKIRFVDDTETVSLFVESGLGFTILQDSLSSVYKPTTLKFVAIEGVNTPIETVIVWKKDNTNPALQYLLDIINYLRRQDREKLSGQAN